MKNYLTLHIGKNDMIAAVIQARLGSTRLPRKVMKTFNGVPFIKILIERVKLSKTINQVIVATGPIDKNLELIEFLAKEKINFFCGSEDNVLDRYINASKSIKADTIIRITADCPLIDPMLIDIVVNEFLKNDFDYVSNINPPTFPDGQDIEVIKYHALKDSLSYVENDYDKEHVTPFIRRNKKYKKKSVLNDIDYSNLRWTLDTELDLITINNVFDYFYPETNFSWIDILELYKKNPVLFESNKNLIRNAGVDL